MRSHNKPNEIQYILYYDVSCPFCRQIRILMEENSLSFKLLRFNRYKSEEENTKNYFSHNFTGKNPLIGIKLNNTDMVYAYGIWHCINLVNIKQTGLIPIDFKQKILTNNILTLINTNFYDEVVSKIIYEKIIKYFISKAVPNSILLNQSRKNLEKYLKVFTQLVNVNTKITSEDLSLSDIALFSHLSILDYINEINWSDNFLLKEWYLILKSKPSFRSILNDFISGFAPSHTYKSLDF